MNPERISRGSLRWMRGVMPGLASLFLCLSAISSVGCALFSPPSHVVGIERCPTMSEEAILSWAQLYTRAGMDLRVWMGQTIVYCEDIAEMID